MTQNLVRHPCLKATVMDNLGENSDFYYQLDVVRDVSKKGEPVAWAEIICPHGLVRKFETVSEASDFLDKLLTDESE